MAEPGVPLSVPDLDTEPIEIPLDTRRYIDKRIANSSGLRPIDIAHALREGERLRRIEEEVRKVEEGHAKSWIQRKWKQATAWGTALLALSGISYRGWTWIEESAEQRVLERQAGQQQSRAVDENTKAIKVINTSVEGNATKIEAVDSRLTDTQELQRLQLELQLANPSTKRVLAGDPELAAKVKRLAPI